MNKEQLYLRRLQTIDNAYAALQPLLNLKKELIATGNRDVSDTITDMAIAVSLKLIDMARRNAQEKREFDNKMLDRRSKRVLQSGQD